MLEKCECKVRMKIMACCKEVIDFTYSMFLKLICFPSTFSYQVQDLCYKGINSVVHEYQIYVFLHTQMGCG